MIQRFFSGFGFVFAGKNLLSQVPKIRRWMIIPFILDFCLLGVGLYFGSGFIGQIVNKAMLMLFTSAEGFLYNLLYYPLHLLFWVVFVVLYFYLVYIVASVLASPFYSIMAEKTLNHLGHNEAAERTWTQALLLGFKMFRVSLFRGLIMLSLGLFIFIASFIPGLNLFAGFALFVIIALDTLDYSFEAKGLGLRQRFSLLRHNLPELTGMAAFVGLTVLIPGLILLVMPMAVVGSSAQVAKMLERKT